MSDLSYTPSQREAIDVRGRAVLVSAGAGSGKTRVLTQRLIERVTEGENIDRFLVITFTRSAAAELRGRIRAALDALAAAHPQDRRLRRQSALLYRASIGTIDSFCATVVRENAQKLDAGLSPGFSVLDAERADGLLERAAAEALDRAYEDLQDDPGFRALADGVGAGRDDSRLESVLIALYRQLQSRPDPAAWLRERLAELARPGVPDAAQTPWGRAILAGLAADAARWAESLEEELAAMREPGYEKLAAAYADGFSDAALLLRDAARAAAESWDGTRAVLGRPWPSVRAARSGALPDPGVKDRAKAVWDDAKKAAEAMRTTLAMTSDEHRRALALTTPALTVLAELLSRLDREYAARKRRADAIDFSDAEHFAYRLLTDPDGGPTELSRRLSARFAEVMVDEYQDVNELQEQLFRRVSGEGERLFMVGDVKQSIYRFRLAEPEIFHKKYASFGADPWSARVDLRENFRSRPEVLDACNAVFRRIMSPALGDVAYDDRAALLSGADYYPPNGGLRPELCLVAAEDLPKNDARLAEARYVARRIRAMVDAGEPVYDGKGGLRPVQYRDIAVLLRTPGSSGAMFRRALAEAGVPADARQGSGFFAQPEVVFAAAMLAVTDNPLQDVPLIAALRGLPFAFTPDELAAIRAEGSGALWPALCRRAESDAKAARFVSLVGKLRDLAREEPTDALLRQLYDRTGLFAACEAMPDGARRSADLMRLYEYARQFEAEGGRGLFRFTAWLRKLRERGEEPPAAAGGNAVQLMSIHKSKGLEFPVVFLADTGHRWSRGGDDAVLCHSALGLGLRATDPDRGVSWPTLPWLAIRQRAKREELSEQERVLYVAMTRARERLIVTCAASSSDLRLAAAPPSDRPLPPPLLAAAPSMAAWLIRAAAADGGRTIDLRVVSGPDRETDVPDAEAARPEADPAAVEALSERLAWTYPRGASQDIPSKLTATGIRGASDAPDPEAAPLSRDSGPHRFRTPDLGRADRPLTGAERGIAAHLVMQHIDYARADRREGVAAEIARLRAEGFLTEAQAAAVPPEDILAFSTSEVGRRLRRADRVLREFRFSLLCPAGTWFPAAPEGEEILLQGVVDCCLEEDGALTVIDFKTDRSVEPGRYADQLAAYAMAMERIEGKPVREAVLWYLRRREAVRVPLDGDRTRDFTKP